MAKVANEEELPCRGLLVKNVFSIGAGGISLMFTLFIHLISCLHVVITSKCCESMMDMVCTICQPTLQN